jgi:hypothetical protein
MAKKETLNREISSMERAVFRLRILLRMIFYLTCDNLDTM